MRFLVNIDHTFWLNTAQSIWGIYIFYTFSNQILNFWFFFQGSQYSVASDLWSLGLSLLEISFGMYPIPPPDTSTQVQLFGPQVLEDNLISPHPKTPRTPRSPGTKPMAIFELLEYIVNQPAPKLPKRIFSDNMRDFVERCLKKNPTERPDLSSLMVSIDI